MNTAEHIVELYYRFILNCFTISDIKIPFGNNRQFDLLALKPKKENPQLFHVEIGVTHDERWTMDLDQLKNKFEYKFFGTVKEKITNSKRTDKAKGKNYFKPISEVYKNYGFNFEEVVRVYCIWHFKHNDEDFLLWRKNLANDFKINENKIVLLSFRDTVLPELIKGIKTNNYDDDLLRILSLLNQYELQTNKFVKSSITDSNIEKFFGRINDNINLGEIDNIIYGN
ncbi:MAG: hypothetical protein ABI840_06735 [bacterium]